MFPQLVSTKKADGKTYRYLHIVESYRDGKHVKKRHIATLDNIDDYSEKDIKQIIIKLQSLLQNQVLGSLDDLNPKATLHFGIPYVVQFLWKQLGLLVTPDDLPITHEVFSGETADKSTVPDILKRLKEDFNVRLCVFVGDRGMVTNKNLILLAQAESPSIVGYHKLSER